MFLAYYSTFTNIVKMYSTSISLFLKTIDFVIYCVK